MKDIGDFKRYNDYELLYLIRENIEEAKEILFWKYSFLIKSRIYKLHIPTHLWDDFYQEGCIMLCKAIKIYDENSKMSFTNFFDLLLKRRILTLIRKESNYLKCESIYNLDEIVDFNNNTSKLMIFEDDLNYLSAFEKVVYQKAIINGERIDNLARELNVSTKSISNAKHRIVKKMKNKIKNLTNI